MPRIGVTTEDIMRRLVELERLVGGWPVNERAHRRRHIVNVRATGLKEGVLDGDLEFGGTATVSIHVNGSDTGVNETGVTCFMLNSGKKLPQDAKVTIARINGIWRVIGCSECEEDI